MASNQTPNLGLSQWQRTDPFTMDEFNADYAKIDAALGAQPYRVLLRQTLAQNASSILLDLSGIDLTEHPRLRLELSGTAYGTGSSGEGSLYMWYNDITEDYYCRSVGDSSTAAERSNIQSVSYTHLTLPTNSRV